MTNDERMTNDEAQNGSAYYFVIRASKFLRPSTFDIRIF